MRRLLAAVLLVTMPACSLAMTHPRSGSGPISCSDSYLAPAVDTAAGALLWLPLVHELATCPGCDDSGRNNGTVDGVAIMLATFGTAALLAAISGAATAHQCRALRAVH